jgi:hypothetical protein
MALVAIAFGFLLVISAYRIAVTHSLSRTARGVLLGFRFFLLALIAIALIEPALVFEQLPAPLRPVPILVDVSKSMQLFAHDPAMNKVMSALDKWNSDHAEKKRKFTFYCFGDSLRPVSRPATCFFSDRRSFLPEFFKNKALRRADAILLISDGNWTNTSLPAENYLDKNVLYLPLRGTPEHRPFLQMEIRDIPFSSPADSPLVAVVEFEGFSRRPDSIIMSVAERNRTIAQRKIPVPEGLFKQTARIPLKNLVTGRFFFRFNASLRQDTLYCSRYAQHTALPGRFTYELCNSRPVLDRRFIQLALKRQMHFIETFPGSSRDLDLLVILNWDDSARTALNRLKPGGVALYIGCIPCSVSPAIIQAAGAAAVIRPLSGVPASPFDDCDFSKLPPPLQYFSCKELTSRVRNIFISAVLPHAGRPGADTLDVLFSGRYQRNNFIAFAATDAWRWDFWPLAVEPDEGRVFGFSERLIELTKEVLINGLSEELLFFPAAQLSESDSLQFLAVFPSHLPIPSGIFLSITFSSTGTVPYDTAFEINFTGSPHHIVRLKTMPAGHYRLKVSAAASTPSAVMRCSFPDSVSIDKDRSEYLVQGQNNSLLQGLAQPLDNFSDSSLRSIFFRSGTEMKHPVKETMRLNRNWPLLLIIFLVFAAEWIMRRIMKAE